ncbi:hypothetical protein AB6D11_00695 [Vibrio splendidus]
MSSHYALEQSLLATMSHFPATLLTMATQAIRHPSKPYLSHQGERWFPLVDPLITRLGDQAIPNALGLTWSNNRRLCPENTRTLSALGLHFIIDTLGTANSIEAIAKRTLTPAMGLRLDLTEHDLLGHGIIDNHLKVGQIRVYGSPSWIQECRYKLEDGLAEYFNTLLDVDGPLQRCHYGWTELDGYCNSPATPHRIIVDPDGEISPIPFADEYTRKSAPDGETETLIAVNRDTLERGGAQSSIGLYVQQVFRRPYQPQHVDELGPVQLLRQGHLYSANSLCELCPDDYRLVMTPQPPFHCPD